MPRDRPNTRVKDLPDLALLASAGGIDGKKLRSAIAGIFGHRATHPIPSTTPQPPSAWAPVYERMAKSDGLHWSNLDELVEAVRGFLDPILSGGSGHWVPSAWAWTSEEVHSGGVP